MDQLDPLDEAYIQKLLILQAVTSSDAGISFMQWLCRLTGFGKPSMSMEDAARRDVWLTIRQFVDVNKLSEIEHHDLRQQQKTVQEIIQAAAITKEESDD